jgi:hypothetical protein
LELRKLFGQVSNKGNFTVAALVPDTNGVNLCAQYGFPRDNIKIWNTTEAGLTEAVDTIQQATENFMQGRAKGIRSTKNLFNLDVSKLNTKAVKGKLDELPPDKYMLLTVHKDAVIKPFVESWTKETYRPGSAYYPLTKKETIQGYKQIVIQEKASGKVYSGDKARQLLGLPTHEVKVAPDQHNKFNIYVQSTSLNRKLVGGTNVIVLK